MFGIVSDIGAFRQSVCVGPQFLSGNSAEVMPMSPRNAAKVCWASVGWFAFQPKRPSAVACFATSHTWFVWPPFVAAKPSMVASSTASSRPSPTICGASRGEIRMPSASGPNPRSTIVYVGARRPYAWPSAYVPGCSA